METSKEIFDTIKSLTKTKCFIKGWGEIIETEDGFKLKDFTADSFVNFAGCFPEDLILEAFDKEFICEVDKAGMYEFEALLSYSAEQRGDYPPPNLECVAYMEVDHIEYKFVCSKEDALIQEQEMNEILNQPLPF